MIAVVILTKNEANDLQKCIQSLRWASEIWVLDSGSTDDTLAIAQAAGVNVVANQFVTFGQQRNYALDQLPIKAPWVLFMDADEVATPKFEEAVKNAVSRADLSVSGYYCCWKLMLGTTWLKRSDNFPKWQFRLIRKGAARFTDFGHGQKEADVVGKIGYIKEPYMHYGFSKGWSHWLDRHNKYAFQEALARLEHTFSIKNLFSAHSSTRNPELKFVLSRMPGWPLMRFIYTYFLCLGFIEGRPGLDYCINMAHYESLIRLKMRELKQEKSR